MAGMDSAGGHDRFLQALQGFKDEHRGRQWRGSFGEFLEHIVPRQAHQVARNSHQYIWDMLCWMQRKESGESPASAPRLFSRELFGMERPLARISDYFKAASAGSEVGRRLLLLLGPPSGGKSSLVILLKRGLEEYSHTEDGALYALQGSPLHENPLNLVPWSLRGQFRDTYGVEIQGEPSPWARSLVEDEYQGDFMRVPVERVFLSESRRVGVGTYAPHDPSTADIADLIGSVDLARVADYGDEGDPRAWSWSGAVYAASRGMLEMIEILKVKREFLYLLLTLTQERNVKVARFPLIHVDETIIAHTNLAEFRRFLQEQENEALLDRMVIVQVPYTLNYHDEARIYRKLIAAAPSFRDVHLDPHALELAAVFAVLSRLQPSEREDLDLSRKLRLYAGEDVDGHSRAELERIRHESDEEGLSGVSPRFVVNALSGALSRSERQSLSSMDVLITLKDAIENDARIEARQRRQWVDYLVTARKDFYNHWVKEDVHKALFVSFEQESQELLEKYLDEVEASLDNRPVEDPITNETRRPDERFLRAVEEKINISDAGKHSFRQEVVRKAMMAFKKGERFTLDAHARLREAMQQYLFEERREVLRLVTSSARPDDQAQQKIAAVAQRLIDEYGYDEHSAREALSYVTTLLSQE
ncbi:serine protein kinase [Alkalilimnicola sp. S0819]|uniref:serine protein kinase n=1 Tax=Alkalilimnicola sp. S0819 TaxID=2613922 RepID=UPI0012625130|nr:serine protein kinase [Alkalilimnicola sp. S0819]KAB7624299.1 serine protein kinase [Alkalilimnicola sp. S0819]MPQ16123.1 serine protein kinase [Alkalilimnicola sp. S0819]